MKNISKFVRDEAWFSKEKAAQLYKSFRHIKYKTKLKSKV